MFPMITASLLSTTSLRRIGSALLVFIAVVCVLPPLSGVVVDIGSRRELFVDDFMIERLDGKAEVRLHRPSPREVVLVFDAAWEGSGSGYQNIFKDGNLYRMYYKGVQIDPVKETDPQKHTNYLKSVPLCYAESDDGIHWRRPSLGLNEFRGSKDNNIVILGGTMEGVDIDPGAAAVFKDENPAAPADARYKAILHSRSPSRGLVVLKSADGLRWSLLTRQAVITAGAFDSQNLAFWDANFGGYRAYWRYFSRDPREATLALTSGVLTPRAAQGAVLGYGQPTEGAAVHLGVRSIRTATSKDLIHWEGMANVRYVDSPEEHLYTNQVKPYHRAPHLLIGIPTRYVERELKGGSLDDARAKAGPEKTRLWSASMRALPELEHRELRAGASERYGSAITEGVLMASRDGVTFKRWNEAFFPPGIERDGVWNYGQHFFAWHIVETKSADAGAPNELSFFGTESMWTGNSNELRRYTLRLDGFVSAHAPRAGGALLTKPFRFRGKHLALNFATSAIGSVRVEVQTEDGRPVPGFTLDDCEPIFGDTVERVIGWRGGSDVSSLASRPVRLRFVLSDADLFAFQFKE